MRTMTTWRRLALSAATLQLLAVRLTRACDLNEIYNASFLIGAALNEPQFRGDDERAVAIVTQHYNTISPENALKWDAIHPGPDAYDFSAADAYVDFGTARGMFVHGHTILWHWQTPDWVFEGDGGRRRSRAELLRILKAHIDTVIGRYRGRIGSWDVANEVVDDNGYLRRSKWLQGIGDDYIEQAFRFARAADPGAKLFYNDYSLEQEPKRGGALRLVRRLKSLGLIDGVGLQSHYGLATPTTQQITETIDLFSQVGLEVAISELDLDVLPPAWFCLSEPGGVCDAASHDAEWVKKYDPYGQTGALPAEAALAEQQRFGEVFAAFLSRSAAIARVTFWGVTDSQSWLNFWPVKSRTAFPLPFNRDYSPKPPFDVLIGLCDHRR